MSIIGTYQRRSIARRLQTYTWKAEGRTERENFLTELLAGVMDSSVPLRQWFTRVLQAAVDRGNLLSSSLYPLPPILEDQEVSDELGITLETQSSVRLIRDDQDSSNSSDLTTGSRNKTKERRPDIRLLIYRGNRITNLYFLENKVDAGWGEGQAEDYREAWKKEVDALKLSEETAGGVVCIARTREQINERILSRSEHTSAHDNTDSGLHGGLTWQELAIGLKAWYQEQGSRLFGAQEEGIVYEPEAFHSLSWAWELLQYLREEIGIVTEPYKLNPIEAWNETRKFLQVLRKAGDDVRPHPAKPARQYYYEDHEGLYLGWRWTMGEYGSCFAYIWAYPNCELRYMYVGIEGPDKKWKRETERTIEILPVDSGTDKGDFDETSILESQESYLREKLRSFFQELQLYDTK